MYEHMTRFIEDLDDGRFDESAFTHALYDPPVFDRRYRETLEAHGLDGMKPWGADVEHLDLPTTLALLTFVHRADHFSWGALQKAVEDGFLRRILVRLSELEEEMRSHTIIGFWKDDEPNGFCSNWYPAGFEFFGTEFKTSEHWMMWQKARVMGASDMEQKILDAPTPGEAKALGRKIPYFDGDLWNDVSEQLVYYGVREKFLANPALGSMLMATGSALLCEATPPDRVWGIGMSVDDPSFNRPASWKGKNLQGRVCMRVRTDLGLCGGELPDRKEMVEQLLDSQIGRMNLTELSRVPVARPAVKCYARIAAEEVFSTPVIIPDNFFDKTQWMDARIQDMAATNLGGYLPTVGWRELLVQLAFLQHTKQL